MSMELYVDDPRVEDAEEGDGYVLPDPDEDIFVEPDHSGAWTIRTAEGGYLTDPGDRYNQRPQRFNTADGAIAHILGEPCVTVTEEGLYLVADEWLVFEQDGEWRIAAAGGALMPVDRCSSAADAVNAVLRASRAAVA